VDQRHLQNTADAAALAGAQEIANAGGTSCTPTCAAFVTSYATQNGFSAPSHGILPCTATATPYPAPDASFDESTTCYTWPYQGNNQLILVKLRTCTPTFFGSVVGFDQICASVRSVADASILTHVNTTVIQGNTIPGSTLWSTTTIVTPPTANAGLFALNSTCGNSPAPAIEISSNNATITGSVYSNGGIKTDNSSYTFNGGPVSYNAACTGGPGQPSGHFPAGSPITNGGGAPYPYILTAAQLTAICNAAVLNRPTTAITAAQITTPGVYCSGVKITAPNTTMAVTMIAPNVVVNGNHFQHLSPFLATGPANKGLLAYILGPDYPSPYSPTPASTPVAFSANNGSITGDVIAPDTTVDINGVAYALGFIEAKSIVISENGVLVGDGPATGVPGTSTTISTATGTVTGVTQPAVTNSSTVTTGTTLGLTG
jgi:hypothetical protein